MCSGISLDATSDAPEQDGQLRWLNWVNLRVRSPIYAGSARKIWFLLPRRNAEAADLPKVLKYPMDKAQDARNFMLASNIGWEALQRTWKTSS